LCILYVNSIDLQQNSKTSKNNNLKKFKRYIKKSWVTLITENSKIIESKVIALGIGNSSTLKFIISSLWKWYIKESKNAKKKYKIRIELSKLMRRLSQSPYFGKVLLENEGILHCYIDFIKDIPHAFSITNTKTIEYFLDNLIIIYSLETQCSIKQKKYIRAQSILLTRSYLNSVLFLPSCQLRPRQHSVVPPISIFFFSFGYSWGVKITEDDAPHSLCQCRARASA